MRESLQHEKVALMAYCDLLKNGKDSNRQEPGIQAVFLEEYERKMIIQEEMHLNEVSKILHKPGEIKLFRA